MYGRLRLDYSISGRGSFCDSFYLFWSCSVIFPECVATVSLGGLGVGLCSKRLRLRPQPSATVRNRPQPSAWGPEGSPQRRVRLEWSRKRVKLSSGAVVLAFTQDLSVWVICGAAVINIGVCRGGVCVSDLCRRSYSGVFAGDVCVSDLCRRSYIGVWRGNVCVRDPCRRSYIAVCRGGVCVSDLWRRMSVSHKSVR